jgi:hypothetical protein
MKAGRRRMLTGATAFGMLLVGAFVSAQNLDRLIDPYLRIHANLAGDKVEGVSADAKLLAAEAGKLGDVGSSLAAAARELTAATDLKAARAAFGKVSEALLDYAARTKQALGAGVNIVYCPMAKQRWVQRGDQIANPYYGSQMLRCGELQKR